jgi:hypothetical protein
MNIGNPVNYRIRTSNNISKPVYDLVSNSINHSLMDSTYDTIWNSVRELVTISISIRNSISL